MSLEQAILDHAAAIRELAAAMTGSGRRVGMPAALAAPYIGGTGQAEVNAALDRDDKVQQAKDAELEAAVAKVEDEATMTRSTPRAQIDAALAAARAEKAAEAKKAAGSKTAPAAPAAPSTSAPAAPSEPGASLDYAKDVKPTLVELVKIRTRDALVGLLAKYEAKNGESLTAEQLPLILADAQALIKGE